MEVHHDYRKNALDAVFAVARDAVVCEDPRGRILKVNDEFRRMCRDDLRIRDCRSMGSFFAEFIGRTNDPTGLERMMRLRRSRSPLDREEFEVIRPRRRVFEVRSAPVEEPRSGQSDRIWSIADITETRAMELELREAQKMTILGRIAMEVTHDFNNLLTGVNGNLAILEMELEARKIDLPEKQHLSCAIQAGLRAAALVKQLLSFSRRGTRESVHLAVDEVVQEVSDIMGVSIPPTIRLEVNSAEGLWPVEGDANMLSQILINITTNARDALPTGGTIRIETENLEVTGEMASELGKGARAGQFVRIGIVDNGIGMTAEVKERIFDAFFSTKGSGGNGLGLSTSQKIVRQLGGWILVQSSPGKGTRFDVYIPRTDPIDAPQAKPRPEKKRCRPMEQTGPTGETVLVGDDEEGVRMVAVSLLRRMGYRVLVASDGEEALRVVGEEEGKIGLILLDLAMPKLSGVETFARLRSEYDPIPVLICSGYLVDVTAIQEEAGACPEGVIQKPYRMELLTQTVRDVLAAKCSAA